MKCEWVRENILLHIYNELPDDARFELEQHLARCSDCAAELKVARKFHATLSELPVEEPSPNLVASSRMRLQEALETAEQGGWWQRFTFEPPRVDIRIRSQRSSMATFTIISAGFPCRTSTLAGIPDWLTSVSILWR